MKGESFDREDRFAYTGSYRGPNTSQISFPLGGIGTGCIGLGGDGRLIDWEIFNRPNKGSLNGISHFAVRAEADGEVLDTRIVQGDLAPPYQGSLIQDMWAFGRGPFPHTLAGMRHFRDTEFVGEYPIGSIRFDGESEFPGRVVLTAFNPLIPLNDRDSSVPAAFLEYSVQNTSNRQIDFTIIGVLANPYPNEPRHTYENGAITLTSASFTDKNSPEFGDITIGTDAEEHSYIEYLYKGSQWANSSEGYWQQLSQPGKFDNSSSEAPEKSDHSDVSQALLSGHVRVEPGATRAVRFVIAWNNPNFEMYWNEASAAAAKKQGLSTVWKNYYATIWGNSSESARYALDRYQELYRKTLEFKDALFSSTLPAAALDAVSANLSVMKSPTVVRLTDGTLYGFEGSHCRSGCCEGSCTHVWNYSQSIPFLFPGLERSMRDIDYAHNMNSKGAMRFRLALPVGVEVDEAALGVDHPCADGQFGGVMRVYRDWKISGDNGWLRDIWPKVKRSIEFAWHPENAEKWDPDKSGILQGRQHHTLDVDLFGPASWTSGFYLGALKAGAEMAEFLGDETTAREFIDIFETGREYLNRELFNGEYYHQRIDLHDKSILNDYSNGDYYWSERFEEIALQIGDGCEIDQTLAQFHASLYGLGAIYDPNQHETALRSLFKNNFKSRMRDHNNTRNIFSLNDEGALIICTWPEGSYHPKIPLAYSSENQGGYEYAAAVQMIQVGMIDEGMAIVEAIRDRYDGAKRNPWNEFECGSNYARNMVTYSMLNAFSGFEFDIPRRSLGFDPVVGVDDFRALFCVAPGWGTIHFSKGTVILSLLHGRLQLDALKIGNRSAQRVELAGTEVPFTQLEGTILFVTPVSLADGDELIIHTGEPK